MIDASENFRKFDRPIRAKKCFILINQSNDSKRL